MSNPRASCPVIDFVNDLKKTGLYVLGHVHTTSAMEDDGLSADPIQTEYPHWLGLVDHLKVVAEYSLTLSQFLLGTAFDWLFANWKQHNLAA